MNRNVLIAALVAAGPLLLVGMAIFGPMSSVIPTGAVPPSPSPFAAFGSNCEIAPVSKEHVFVAASAYQGDTLTNVQLGDEDSETTMVRIVVASGSKPITVLLQASRPMIWNFEGAVERVARAIIFPGNRNRVAVAGLPAAQVDLVKLEGCPAQAITLNKDNEKRRDELLTAMFGRLADRAATGHSLNSIALPELQMASAPKGGAERAVGSTERELYTYFPGGFRTVDAKSLVSRAEVLTPETYPDIAGLIQLERAGAIRPAERHEIDRFVEGFSNPFRSRLSPNYQMRVGFSYVILRDLMLPAGLNGAHSKNFLVLSGVPAPRGRVGHGCLAYMDGFKAEDRSCYGDAWDEIERLKKLPDANSVQCRLLTPAANVSVEAVSMYEPKGAKHSFASTREPSPVDVKVSKPGAVLLVLNTYEPAIWRVVANEGTQIAGVILTGYYASKVEGVSPATPVISGGLRKPPKSSAGRCGLCAVP